MVYKHWGRYYGGAPHSGIVDLLRLYVGSVKHLNVPVVLHLHLLPKRCINLWKHVLPHLDDDPRMVGRDRTFAGGKFPREDLVKNRKRFTLKRPVDDIQVRFH